MRLVAHMYSFIPFSSLMMSIAEMMVLFSRLLLAFGKRVRPCRPVSVGLEMLLRFLICVIASLFGVWIVFKSGFFFSVGESASMFTIRCELQ